MRKVMLLVAMVAMVLATATVAYAVTKEGNNGDNYLGETCGNDRLFGNGGNDTLDANNCTFANTVGGNGDVDTLVGNTGNDRLLANDGDSQDALNGGPGTDLCVVDDRSELAGGCNKIRVR